MSDHPSPSPTPPADKPITLVHNHGPHTGLGIACRERIIDGRLVGECISPPPTPPDALRLAAIRLGILADRIEGCNEIAREEGRPITHELIEEARMFEHEAREAAGLPPRRAHR